MSRHRTSVLDPQTRQEMALVPIHMLRMIPTRGTAMEMASPMLDTTVPAAQVFLACLVFWNSVSDRWVSSLVSRSIVFSSAIT